MDTSTKQVTQTKTIRYFTKETLPTLCAEDQAIVDGSPEGMKFPATMAFLHNDVEIRCSVVLNNVPVTVWLTVPIDTYNALPTVERELDAETAQAVATSNEPLHLPQGDRAVTVKPVSQQKPKRISRPKSRAQRWADAVADCRTKLEAVTAARDEFMEAVHFLAGIREEFEMWKENLPEAFQSSALGEKLDAICEIDLDPSEDDIEAMGTVVDDAEAVEVPLGFGRD